MSAEIPITPSLKRSDISDSCQIFTIAIYFDVAPFLHVQILIPILLQRHIQLKTVSINAFGFFLFFSWRGGVNI